MKSDKEKVVGTKNGKSDGKNKLKTIGYIVFFLILLGIKPGTPIEYDY